MGIVQSSAPSQKQLDPELILEGAGRQLAELDSLLALEKKIDLSSASGHKFMLLTEEAGDYRAMIARQVAMVGRLEDETPQNPLLQETLQATENNMMEARGLILQMNSVLDGEEEG
jgi:hypothetical protein